MKFDQFELDLGRYELRCADGRVVKLEKIPLELLILLARKPGQLVTREEIIARLWGGDVFVDTRQGINTAVRKIRLALKDDPDDPRVVETVFGRGYRLVAPLTSSNNALTPAPAATASEALPAAPVVSAPAAGPRGPLMSAGWARGLFLAIQLGYLAMYAAAFLHVSSILGLGLPRVIPILTLLVGLIGAALRLYLLAAVGLDYAGSGPLFRSMFPGVLALDAVWAASPLFLFHGLGALALLAVVALAFLPFSQRTLMSCAYPSSTPRRS